MKLYHFKSLTQIIWLNLAYLKKLILMDRRTKATIIYKTAQKAYTSLPKLETNTDRKEDTRSKRSTRSHSFQSEENKYVLNDYHEEFTCSQIVHV